MTLQSVNLSCYFLYFFFFNETATTEIYTTTDTLSLHDALPISVLVADALDLAGRHAGDGDQCAAAGVQTRSEEHTSALQSPVVISYAVFCLKNKKMPVRTQARFERETAPLAQQVSQGSRSIG